MLRQLQTVDEVMEELFREYEAALKRLGMGH